MPRITVTRATDRKLTHLSQIINLTHRARLLYCMAPPPPKLHLKMQFTYSNVTRPDFSASLSRPHLSLTPLYTANMHFVPDHPIPTHVPLFLVAAAATAFFSAELLSFYTSPPLCLFQNTRPNVFSKGKSFVTARVYCVIIVFVRH